MRADIGVLLIRLVGAGLAAGHGIPKLAGLIAGTSRFPEAVANMGFPAPTVFAWAAALAETVGGTFVALGLFTQISAATAASTMVVAAFIRHHAHDHLLAKLGLRTVSEETLASWGNPELALIYLLPLLGVALIGPGRLSLDAVRRGPRVGGKK
jgi:putative oxidoreductase